MRDVSKRKPSQTSIQCCGPAYDPTTGHSKRHSIHDIHAVKQPQDENTTFTHAHEPCTDKTRAAANTDAEQPHTIQIRGATVPLDQQA